VKFIDEVRRYASSSRRIAPSEGRTIVAAHPGEPGNLSVNIRPIQAGRRDAGFQNNNRAPYAGLHQMHSPAANVHQSSKWRIVTPIRSAAYALIEHGCRGRANHNGTNDDCQKQHEN
jgi:hypothetical protein